jgi:Ca-activated chloride channel family protein
VRLHSDLVIVNVTVVDSEGKYAHGLTGKDFAVVEDGATQTIDSFSSDEAPFAAAILIDMSGSMTDKFGLARAAAASFVERIRDEDQVAVYGFNRKVWRLQDFSNARDITDYIWDAKAEHETQLYDCMREGIEALAARAERRRALLVISDGWDSASRRATKDSALKKALEAGVTIYSLDLTDDQKLLGAGREAPLFVRGRHELKEFAQQTGGRYVHSPNGLGLEEAFVGIIDELRNQYTITYYPTNTKRDGRWRTIKVGVARPGLTVRNRRGYYSPKA